MTNPIESELFHLRKLAVQLIVTCGDNPSDASCRAYRLILDEYIAKGGPMDAAIVKMGEDRFRYIHGTRTDWMVSLPFLDIGFGLIMVDCSASGTSKSPSQTAPSCKLELSDSTVIEIEHADHMQTFPTLDRNSRLFTEFSTSAFRNVCVYSVRNLS